MMKRTTLLTAILSALALASPLAAEEAPAPITTGNPDITTGNLELLLTPLTKQELAVESEAWRDLVKAQAEKMAQLSIAGANEQDPDQKSKTNETLIELQAAKSKLLTSFETVLAAYEEKGGDPTELRTYAKAVAGFKTNGTDPSANISFFRSWITSSDGGLKWLFGALKFLAIIAIFWIVAAIAARITRNLTERHLEWSGLLERFINKLVKRAILIVGLLVALSSIGINVGALLALIGGGAFIIGFALQDTLGNFAAGVMLLIYRPFDVGDFVETAGVMGSVDNVSLVSTTIRTPDNKVILVPNKQVWGQVITNATASKERRVDLTFGIGYGDDIAKAQTILEDIITKHEKVLTTPAPVIKVNELADSSVNFVCRPWSKTSDYWDVYWDITRKVKEEFDANNISIPFPQRDIHIHQAS